MQDRYVYSTYKALKVLQTCNERPTPTSAGSHLQLLLVLGGLLQEHLWLLEVCRLPYHHYRRYIVTYIHTYLSIYIYIYIHAYIYIYSTYLFV